MVALTQSAAQRVTLQPAYVLHHRPYRDTSEIVELFTRDYGRLTVFVRGVRGAKKRTVSSVPTLQPFHRLLVSFTGRGEAAQVTGVEFDGALSSLPAARTLSGFYLNELLMRLFERHDAHADVFELYGDTIETLKNPQREEAALLRIFEKRLLECIGYGMQLETEAHGGEAINPHGTYRYIPEVGLRRLDGVAEGDLIFSGAALLALSTEQLSNPTYRSDARRLLRAAIDQYLAGRGLRSRDVLSQLRRMRER